MSQDFFITIKSDIRLLTDSFSNFPKENEAKNKVYLAAIRVISAFAMTIAAVKFAYPLFDGLKNANIFEMIFDFIKFELAFDIYKIAKKISDLSSNHTLAIMHGPQIKTHLEELKDKPSKEIAENLAESTFFNKVWTTTHELWANRTANFFVAKA